MAHLSGVVFDGRQQHGRLQVAMTIRACGNCRGAQATSHKKLWRTMKHGQSRDFALSLFQDITSTHCQSITTSKTSKASTRAIQQMAVTPLLALRLATSKIYSTGSMRPDRKPNRASLVCERTSSEQPYTGQDRSDQWTQQILELHSGRDEHSGRCSHITLLASMICRGVVVLCIESV